MQYLLQYVWELEFDVTLSPIRVLVATSAVKRSKKHPFLIFTLIKMKYFFSYSFSTLVICESWFTGSQILGELSRNRCVNLVRLILVKRLFYIIKINLKKWQKFPLTQSVNKLTISKLGSLNFSSFNGSHTLEFFCSWFT